PDDRDRATGGSSAVTYRRRPGPRSPTAWSRAERPPSSTLYSKIESSWHRALEPEALDDVELRAAAGCEVDHRDVVGREPDDVGQALAVRSGGRERQAGRATPHLDDVRQARHERIDD